MKYARAKRKVLQQMRQIRQMNCRLTQSVLLPKYLLTTFLFSIMTRLLSSTIRQGKHYAIRPVDELKEMKRRMLTGDKFILEATQLRKRLREDVFSSTLST